MSRIERDLLLVWTALTAAVVLAGLGGPVRVALVLSWVALAPGLALCAVAGFGPLALRLFLAPPVSLALAATVSGLLIYAGLPTGGPGMGFLFAVTFGVLTFQVPFVRTFLLRRSALSADVRGKLAEEARQAALIEALVQGGSLEDAAEAAGVSVATVRRRIRESESLRRAVRVVSDDLAAEARVERDEPKGPVRFSGR